MRRTVSSDAANTSAFILQPFDILWTKPKVRYKFGRDHRADVVVEN